MALTADTPLHPAAVTAAQLPTGIGEGEDVDVVVIRLGSDDFRCPRAVLLRHSRYFESRLTNFLRDDEPADDDGSLVLTLDAHFDFGPDVLSVILTALVSPGPPFHPDLNRHNVFEVLMAVYFLQADVLIKPCVDFILSLCDTGDIVAAWKFSSEFHVSELQTALEAHMRHMQRLRQRKFGRPDFVLVYGPSLRLPCHSYLVCEQSPFLRRLVAAAATAPAQTACPEIDMRTHLTHEQYQACYDSVDWMYAQSDTLTLVDEDQGEQIVLVSLLLECPALTQAVLKTYAPGDVATWRRLYTLACVKTLKPLLDWSLLQLLYHFSDFSHEIDALKYEHLERVLRCDTARVDETDLLLALSRWYCADMEARKEQFRQLYSYIRCSAIPKNISSKTHFHNEINDLSLSLIKKNVNVRQPRKRWPQRLVMVEIKQSAMSKVYDGEAEEDYVDVDDDDVLTGTGKKRKGSCNSQLLHVYNFATKTWDLLLNDVPNDSQPVFVKNSMLYTVHSPTSSSSSKHGVALSRFDFQTDLLDRRLSVMNNYRNYFTGAYLCQSNELFLGPSVPEWSPIVTVDHLDLNSMAWGETTYVKDSPPAHVGGPMSDAMDEDLSSNLLDGSCNADLVADPQRRSLYLVNSEPRLSQNDVQKLSVLETAPDKPGEMRTYDLRRKTDELECRHERVPFGSAFAMYKGRLVRVGGWAYKNERLGKTSQRRVAVFNPDNRFRPDRDLVLPPLGRSRDGCGAVQVGESFVVAGGYVRYEKKGEHEDEPRQQRCEIEKSMEIYCPKKRKWILVEDSFPNIKSGCVKLFVIDAPIRMLSPKEVSI